MTSDTLRPAYDVEALREGVLGAESSWRRLDVVEETGSTNGDLIARAAAGEDVDGVVLVAENQTAGRGRRGRTWSAVPRAQITVSVGVAPRDVPSEAWGLLPLVAGVAVIDAVSEVALRAAGIPLGLKWPNDVLAGVGGAAGKLAGILAEVAPSGPTIVVGIGLNVSLLPEELEDPGIATSMLALGVEAPDRDRVLRALLRHLDRRIGGWRSTGGADERLLADYRARSLTIGSRVRALLPGDSEIVGTATAVDAQGRLLLDTDGGVVAISAGDIVHLRTAGDLPG
ncbi:biotin--[acetyl-CoA-carboxylase] ligase [Mycolicibacterium sp.]|uniref:biotin--[acetyl-CoA-carboxylase] ligase n=1 Tax=Mycolicibacterium sp. TaxID=2320850 RepID=UPI001A2F8570|nr:biotin--[acetyl-CoA-carboxylase] ligase [Mycolicibacterium sp.]MBJ7339075.1 biotin--[acetyl-CoA-carboxylase] ligase [Mycolicibacterium sp.]